MTTFDEETGTGPARREEARLRALVPRCAHIEDRSCIVVGLAPEYSPYLGDSGLPHPRGGVRGRASLATPGGPRTARAAGEVGRATAPGWTPLREVLDKLPGWLGTISCRSGAVHATTGRPQDTENVGVGRCIANYRPGSIGLLLRSHLTVEL